MCCHASSAGNPSGALIAAAAFVAFSATGASAQSPSDAAYCKALADKYVSYVGHDEGSSSRLVRQGTTDAQVAVAQCREGKTASAIPVLERELTRAKITLPARG